MYVFFFEIENNISMSVQFQIKNLREINILIS